MIHETAHLRAFLDGELAPEEMARVKAHVDRCAECAAGLDLLGRRAASVSAGLGALESLTAAPAPQAALVRFRRAEAAGLAAATPAGWWKNVTRSFDMTKRNARDPRWRPALAALGAVVLVALLLSIAPVRTAAADFLSLFRVQKFAVIPLNEQQMNRLVDLANQAEGTLGKPQIVREEGPEQSAGDAAQASSLAGYAVRTPSRLPQGAVLQKFSVKSGPALHMEVDRATLAALMQATGASTEGLPDTEKIAADVDVANFTMQEYGMGATKMQFVQVPSPHVNLPEGLNPTPLAESAFMLLGMPTEDAKRLAASIDWTTTLVIPLPADAVQAREVTIDGVTGLLMEGVNGRSRGESSLIWQKDGMLYALTGRVDSRVLMDAADSLQ